MITEDKQFQTYRVWGIIFAIYITGVIIGAWSDKYFWYVVGSVFLIPVSILINIILKGWTR